MKSISLSGLWIRIALVFIMPWILGVNILAHPLGDAMKSVHQAELQHQPEESLAAWYQVLSFEPWQRNGWLQISMLESSWGNISDAIQAMEHAANLERLTPSQTIALTNLYITAGDENAAQDLLDELASQPNPDSSLYASLVRLAELQGDHEKTLQYLRDWSVKYPSDAQPLYKLGLIMSIDDPQQALAFLNRSVELDETYQFALTTLQPVLSYRDSDQPAYTLLKTGRGLGNLGEWELAREAFSQAIVIEPEYAEAWAFLSESRYQLGLDGSAEIEKALAINPDSVVANGIAAVQMRRLGKSDQALVALYKASRLEPKQGIWHLEIANTLVEMDSIAEAYPHYVLAAELEPENLQFWLSLANYCASTGIHLRDSGLPAARKAILLDENNPDSLDSMGQIMAALGDMSNSIRYLEAALYQQPDHAVSHLHLAQVYLELGDAQHAEEHLLVAQSYGVGDPVIQQSVSRLQKRYFSHP
jgi:tetratricopeptide (TPR) repeat protein